MKIDWDFVQRIHKMLKKFPDKQDEYKELYPEAFKETNIAPHVNCKLQGETWKYLSISFFGKPVAKIELVSKGLYLREDGDVKSTKIRHWTHRVEPGFRINYTDYGITIIKYGPENQKKSKGDELSL